MCLALYWALGDGGKIKSLYKPFPWATFRFKTREGNLIDHVMMEGSVHFSEQVRRYCKYSVSSEEREVLGRSYVGEVHGRDGFMLLAGDAEYDLRRIFSQKRSHS